MSTEASGNSSVETTESHFFYDVILTHTIEVEVYFNRKLVNKSKQSTKRRIVPQWGRIITVSAIAVLGLFLCAKLVGF